MQDTNLNLSASDVQLLADTSFFEQKRRLFERIRDGLLGLESELKETTDRYPGILPLEMFGRRGKISRGENLQGLPWMVLDYPAYFSKESIIAFRTLFWWGHPLSITLHLSGKFLRPYGMNLVNHASQLDESLVYCISSEQFIHHFEPSNYKSLKMLRSESFNLESQPVNHGFIKMARLLPLAEAGKMKETFTAFCSEMIQLMAK